jgi:hypothetical protein
MPRHSPLPSKPPSTLSFKVGNWFEVQASGWGVLAAPLALLLLLAAALARSLWAA